MILFWLIAAALTAAALAFLLPPLLRTRAPSAPALRAAANASIYREQLEELRADLARGALTREEFDRGMAEIEQRIVAERGEVEGAAEPAQARPRRPTGAAVAIGVLLPLLAGVAYWQLGNPGALQEGAAGSPAAGQPAGHPVTRAQMEALVERLAARLQQNPNDPGGWVLLGRSLGTLGQFERSAAAYGKAVQLFPQDAGLLADHADALAMARGRRLEGEPMAIIQRALALDPGHLKALSLAGSAEFERKDYAAAIRYWERILKLAPPDSEFARSVAGSIGEARTLSGQKPAPRAQGAEKSGQAKNAAVTAVTAVTGTVSLDPKVAAQASPGDTVFILARPAGGARMPIAVARTTVSQLPYNFTLDDSMAMAPGATISSQSQLVIVARVSKAGSAAPRKGDIEGTSAPVAPGASGLKIVLSRVIE